jgi:hypothetical protein
MLRPCAATTEFPMSQESARGEDTFVLPGVSRSRYLDEESVRTISFWQKSLKAERSP